MSVQEQKITTFSFISRFLKMLLRPGAIGHLRSLLTSRPEDEISLVDYLEKHAEQRPHDAAILYEDQRIGWGELNTRINKMAHYFRSRGVGHGDSVAINIENRPEVLISVMACKKLGAIAGMVNTSQTNEALAHSLKLIDPKLVLVGSECLSNMDSIAELLDTTYRGKLLYLADGNHEGAPGNYDDLTPLMADMPGENIRPEKVRTLGDACFYIFTSGTTGLPKASITTNMKIFRAGIQFGCNVMTLTKDDIYYCALPFYHSTGLLVGWGSCVASGATMAVRRKFSASNFFDDCRKFEATACVYIGELLRYLLALPEADNDRDHKVVKIIGNGLRPDIWMAFKERFGIDRIHEFYGASEGNTGFVNIFNFDKTVGWSPGHGKAWTLVEFDVDADAPVRADNGFMNKMGVGESGLLIMRINEQNPFDGYTDAQASEKKILRNVFEPGDQWFNSGDLVVLQPHGHIQFGDRIGDTFRWQGENVATTEVEGVIMKWPEIEDAVVYGVQVPGRDGRCGMLYLTLNEADKLDFEGLIKHMRDNLPGYAVPRFIRIGVKVDVTGTFKFQKAKLKREAYDFDTLEDKIYLVARDEASSQPMSDALRDQINSGEIRL